MKPSPQHTACGWALITGLDEVRSVKPNRADSAQLRLQHRLAHRDKQQAQGSGCYLRRPVASEGKVVRRRFRLRLEGKQTLPIARTGKAFPRTPSTIRTFPDMSIGEWLIARFISCGPTAERPAFAIMLKNPHAQALGKLGGSVKGSTKRRTKAHYARISAMGVLARLKKLAK